MRCLVAAFIALTIVIQPGSAAAFGPRGHQITGAIADHLLSANARAQVHDRLGLSLQAAATWADCVKDVVAEPGGSFIYQPDPRYHAGCSAFETAAGMARMVRFARLNWSNCARTAPTVGCHASYHFTDVDIGHDRYERSFVGTSDHDVVSALAAAIAVLQGQRAPPPFAIQDQTEALLLVAHLVGDLHQPLHVGAIYLDVSGRPVDPDRLESHKIARASTRGGNRLEDGETNLHAAWDEAPKSLKPSKLSASMLKAAREIAVTPGNVDAWPRAWATETIGVARESVRAIAFNPYGARMERDWVVEFQDRASYLKMKDEVQVRQLTLAGARLAQILNAIWP